MAADGTYSGAEAGIDWADAFDNIGHVPGAAELIAQGAEDAKAFREAASNASFDLAYGTGARQKLDLFLPVGTPRGLAVFIHGGYWHKLSKDDWSHMAAGALARGWAMAVPSYTLAPGARISDMTREMAQAVAFAAARVAGPLRIAGHSAGGHLALRMACKGGPLSPDVAARLERVVSISGLHDLRPLLLSPLNDILHLDAAEAAAESPALCDPIEGPGVTLWVGGDERPEFLRQAALMSEAWGGAPKRVIENCRHHFDVVEGLAAPTSPLVEAFLG